MMSGPMVVSILELNGLNGFKKYGTLRYIKKLVLRIRVGSFFNQLVDKINVK